jgi:hypothetical protein
MHHDRRRKRGDTGFVRPAAVKAPETSNVAIAAPPTRNGVPLLL